MQRSDKIGTLHSCDGEKLCRAAAPVLPSHYHRGFSPVTRLAWEILQPFSTFLGEMVDAV
jgi:hypothetical protein